MKIRIRHNTRMSVSDADDNNTKEGKQNIDFNNENVKHSVMKNMTECFVLCMEKLLSMRTCTAKKHSS